MAGAPCAGAPPDGATLGPDACGGEPITPPPGGVRLIAGGVGTDGMGAGGIGGPKIELPHCADADCGIQSAQMTKAACITRQAPVESLEVVMPAISTAIAAISSQ